MNKTIISAVVGLLVVAGIGLYAIQTAKQGPMLRGTTNLDSLTLSSNLVVGATTTLAYGVNTSSYGSIATTSTTQTLTQGDISNPVLLVTPNGASLTLTLPASSTLSTLLPTTGSAASFQIFNATTSAISITVAAGTGTNLIKATSTAAIPFGGIGTVSLIRTADTNVQALLDVAK